MHFYFLFFKISFFLSRELGETAIIQSTAMEMAHWPLVFPKELEVSGLWLWAHLLVQKLNIALLDRKIWLNEHEWMLRKYCIYFFREIIFSRKLS